MLKGDASLRLYGVKNCPTLAMTATITKNELSGIVSAFGFRKAPRILASSPIQEHIKFSILRRPSNNYGFDGYTNKKGINSPGLMDLLNRIYLKHYIEDLKAGRMPKKCIIFCRGNSILGELFCRLMEMTDYRYQDCRSSPFVINHSSLFPPTEKVLEERASEISLYLSSNKMLMGINLADIDVIIFLRPYGQPAALVQGAGRGGRKNVDGTRRRVQVYQLYNSQDISPQNKISPEMRNMCLSKECTRVLMRNIFVDDTESHPPVSFKSDFCCHNCDSVK